ncbi:MAG: hypothetical protein J0H29_12935 [Sphingobacteriales bacterium]|nr:hypothetical protein [Sphingobacteriales bacterium]
MGYNDMDYDHGTNRELSFRFANAVQNRLIMDALLWLDGSVISKQAGEVILKKEGDNLS